MPPGAGDDVFLEAWQEVERYLDAARPELILLQCGADSLERRSDHASRISRPKRTRTRRAASARSPTGYAGGRVLAMGGGGYNRANLARAWTRVVEELAA